MTRARDPLANDWRHANTIREIHGRKPRPLCPSCGVPVVLHRGVDEAGGATVAECPRCFWTDFDELQQAAYERQHAHDPEGGLIDSEG